MLPCKPYSGALSKAGYGQRKYRGKMEKAHRVAYAEHHGLSMADIRGKTVRHTCDNPPCCEPTHLLLGDALSNAADRQARGRGAYQRDPTFIPNYTLTAAVGAGQLQTAPPRVWAVCYGTQAGYIPSSTECRHLR